MRNIKGKNIHFILWGDRGPKNRYGLDSIGGEAAHYRL